jgi:predicted secreted hydrolase
MVIFQASRSSLPLLLPAHFAITDLSRSEFHYDQRTVYTPRASVPEGDVTKGINIHAADWSIQGANGQDRLRASMENYAIDLKASASKPAVLHNKNGLITDGLEGFSYYYSRTHMAVTGTLIDHNQTLRVTGLAWMDHQWGNFLTLGGGGWDWYSLHLSDNTEVILYFIRDASGAILSTYGGVIDASGRNTVLLPTSVRSTVLDYWTSSITDVRYPSGWRVDINDPHLKAVLTIQPLLKDQELVTRASTGNTYWEGAVSIEGQRGDGKALGGQGYIELTGYTA